MIIVNSCNDRLDRVSLDEVTYIDITQVLEIYMKECGTLRDFSFITSRDGGLVENGGGEGSTKKRGWKKGDEIKSSECLVPGLAMTYRKMPTNWVRGCKTKLPTSLLPNNVSHGFEFLQPIYGVHFIKQYTCHISRDFAAGILGQDINKVWDEVCQCMQCKLGRQ